MWLWYDKQDEQRIDKHNPGMIGSGQALISSAMHPGSRHTRTQPEPDLTLYFWLSASPERHTIATVAQKANLGCSNLPPAGSNATEIDLALLSSVPFGGSSAECSVISPVRCSFLSSHFRNTIAHTQR